MKDRNICFNCGGELTWDYDFDFEDFGYEGDGIGHLLHCEKCGAQVEYRVPENEQEPTTQDLESSIKYIRDFCKNNDCMDCKFFIKERYQTGCKLKLKNPCDWK